MKLYNEEKIAESISIINDTVLTNMSNSDKLLVLSNMILNISVEYFPTELQDNKTSVASNGKSVAYELMKHVDNVGLNLAIKAHHVIDMAGRLNNDVSI